MLIIVVFITLLTGAHSNPERCIHGKKKNVFHMSPLYGNSGEILIMFGGFHFTFNAYMVSNGRAN